MNGVQTRLKCKPNVKRCKRFVFAAHSPLLHPNTLKTKAIIHFQTDHILTRFVFPPLINYLFHDRINGILPPFVNLGVLGLNYGLQASQFTATSTTAECQTLSNPMYVHSIPNNNDNQDIVSMGTNSALLAKTVIENSYQVMAIQFMGMAQAIDYLKIQDRLSSKSRQVYEEIRSFFPVFTNDTPKYKEIEMMIDYLKKEDK